MIRDCGNQIKGFILSNLINSALLCSLLVALAAMLQMLVRQKPGSIVWSRLNFSLLPYRHLE